MMDDTTEELLAVELVKDKHFNNYSLKYPNGASEGISTVEAIQFLVAQKALTPK